MKKEKENSCVGVSDLIGTILIIILVIGLAAVIAAFLMPNFIQKSAFIASEVRALPITNPNSLRSIEVLGLMSKAGEPFYIIGQPPSYKNGAPVSVRAIGPDGVNHTWAKIDLKAGNLYGRQIYIYPPNYTDPSNCDLCMTDYPPPSSQKLVTMDQGKWTIQFVDENAHILVMSNSDGVITNGSLTSRAQAGNWPGNLFNSHCQPIANRSSNLGPVLVNSSMNNMKYQHFSGSQFISYPSTPDLNFNQDMSISMWFNPSDTSSTYQLIGKGQTTSPGSPATAANEDDNYQVIQVGNQLLFEWNNAASPYYHYQAMTPPTVQANQWNYLTVNVEGGTVKIYNNGVAILPLTYYNNNYHGSPAMSTTPTVNLRPNNYNFYIGNQFQSAWPYSYKGDIGSMGLYNRALTNNEILENYQTYNA